LPMRSRRPPADLGTEAPDIERRHELRSFGRRRGRKLSARQQQRIFRAAEHFLKIRPQHAEAVLRFDVMLVAPWRIPVRLTDAWRESR